MNQRLDAARERLAESLSLGVDTGPMRRAIEQMEDNERAQAEVAAAAEGQRATAAVATMSARVATAVAEICHCAQAAVAAVEQPQVQVQPSPDLEFAVRRDLHLEDALVAVTTRHAERRRACATLANRLGEARQSIGGWRDASARQALTETQAAALNIAILDEADLVQMMSTAQAEVTRMSLAVHRAQTELATAANYMTSLRQGLMVEALRSRSAALESLLVASVDDLWRARRTDDPTVRFLAVWRASPALERAVVHHQPPNGGIA